MEEKKQNNEVVAENAITDDTEIDVGMIEKSILFDRELHKEQHVWLLKGSIWKTYPFSKILDLIHRLQSENSDLREENAILKGNPPMIIGRRNGKTIRAKLLAFDKMKEKNDELQKQVDELKEENAQLYEMADYDKGHKEGYEHGAKTTAKEIISLLEDMDKRGMTVPFNMVLRQLKERYGVEVE